MNKLKSDDTFQEGMIGDALKNAAGGAASAFGVDKKAIRKDWNDDNVNPIGKIKSPITHGLNKVVDTTDNIGKGMKSLQANGQSIIARARNSVLQFPMYVTRSIQHEAAHILSKVFEKVYSTLVQTVLSN